MDHGLCPPYNVRVHQDPTKSGYGWRKEGSYDAELQIRVMNVHPDQDDVMGWNLDHPTDGW